MSARVKRLHWPVHREVGKGGRKGRRSVRKKPAVYQRRKEEARPGGRDGEQEAALRSSMWN